MPDHFIAFWNVENLFSTANDPDRPDYLQKQLKSELKGWTAAVLARKIGQLSKIITAMNAGKGPDVLGVCEVENEAVLKKLAGALAPAGRTYAVAHADSKDRRGIDVAFLYDKAKYKPGKTFSYFIQKRTATRDIFQVTLKTEAGRDFVCLANHWPSRSAGQYASEPYRMMAGETLAYFHKRILEEMGKDTAVLVMGDFNDEPFNRSVREYALATREIQKVRNARAVDYFYNLTWEVLGTRGATYYYGSQPNVLDQFWVSKGIVKPGAPFSVKKDSIAVFMPADLVRKGEYPAARRFSRPSAGNYDPDGYSDHFPITMILKEKG